MLTYALPRVRKDGKQYFASLLDATSDDLPPFGRIEKSVFDVSLVFDGKYGLGSYPFTISIVDLEDSRNTLTVEITVDVIEPVE